MFEHIIRKRTGEEVKPCGQLFIEKRFELLSAVGLNICFHDKPALIAIQFTKCNFQRS